MEDRFLYRAWDKELKKMYYSTGSSSSNDGGACWYSPWMFQLPRDHFVADLIIIQSTGKRDIDNKLLFDGDIISHKFHVWRDSKKVFIEKIYPISWGNVSFEEGDGWEINFDGWKMGNHYLDNLYFKENEIKLIGNIYENPELLNDKPTTKGA